MSLLPISMGLHYHSAPKPMLEKSMVKKLSLLQKGVSRHYGYFNMKRWETEIPSFEKWIYENLDQMQIQQLTDLMITSYGEEPGEPSCFMRKSMIKIRKSMFFNRKEGVGTCDPFYPGLKVHHNAIILIDENIPEEIDEFEQLGFKKALIKEDKNYFESVDEECSIGLITFKWNNKTKDLYYHPYDYKLKKDDFLKKRDYFFKSKKEGKIFKTTVKGYDVCLIKDFNECSFNKLKFISKQERTSGIINQKVKTNGKWYHSVNLKDFILSVQRGKALMIKQVESGLVLAGEEEITKNYIMCSIPSSLGYTLTELSKHYCV